MQDSGEGAPAADILRALIMALDATNSNIHVRCERTLLQSHTRAVLYEKRGVS